MYHFSNCIFIGWYRRARYPAQRVKLTRACDKWFIVYEPLNNWHITWWLTCQTQMCTLATKPHSSPTRNPASACLAPKFLLKGRNITGGVSVHEDPSGLTSQAHNTVREDRKAATAQVQAYMSHRIPSTNSKTEGK